jgi:hypothetical protein
LHVVQTNQRSSGNLWFDGSRNEGCDEQHDEQEMEGSGEDFHGARVTISNEKELAGASELLQHRQSVS